MDEHEIQALAGLLKKLQPGFLPYPIFEQIARLVALPIVEFVPLRRREGRVEVLLIARPDDDQHWPGLLHTPGTVIRATDLDNNQSNWPPFERIAKDELQGTPIGPPHYVGSQLHKSKRGAEQAQLYWVEVLGEPHAGQFYPADNLPPDLIESQRVFIQQATSSFSAI